MRMRIKDETGQWMEVTSELGSVTAAKEDIGGIKGTSRPKIQ